ncbi:MAG: ABC transporter permease [Bacteroidia bacterium]|jgi:ABC-2 type transport system permease protein|nr:ABC transporter permease [Bacteroidia bacterium]
MNKVFLIAKREYLSRVRKKSFLLMTILAPVLITIFYGLIFYFAINRDIGSSKKDIYVIDEGKQYANQLKSNNQVNFIIGDTVIYNPTIFLVQTSFYGILTIHDTNYQVKPKVTLISKDEVSLSTISQIEKQLTDIIKTVRLKASGIDESVLKIVEKTSVSVQASKATSTVIKDSNVGANTIIGYVGAIIIYFFIFLYGVQIMRGVIEEKSNRIVEVIISSVKPFELMLGKISGIALVGLTQFAIWVILGAVFSGNVSGLILAGMENNVALEQLNKSPDAGEIGGILVGLSGFDFSYYISMFVFYFLGGYLFYGSLFAAVGSAVDNETDTQQFMFPLTLPLIFSLVIAQSAITSDPHGSLAVWLSIIPFTSPIVMMVRLPFIEPGWQLWISMISLIAGFIFTTYLASRIYRIGILMYGQKPSYKKIWKWMFNS